MYAFIKYIKTHCAEHPNAELGIKILELLTYIEEHLEEVSLYAHVQSFWQHPTNHMRANLHYNNPCKDGQTRDQIAKEHLAKLIAEVHKAFTYISNLPQKILQETAAYHFLLNMQYSEEDFMEAYLKEALLFIETFRNCDHATLQGFIDQYFIMQYTKEKESFLTLFGKDKEQKHVNIIPDFITYNKTWVFFCYEQKQEAEEQLAYLKFLFQEKYPEFLVYAAVHFKREHTKTPYYFRLSLQQHFDFLAYKEESIPHFKPLPEDQWLIKTIRWDEHCFINKFILGITPSPVMQFRERLRYGTHKQYTVLASGVYPYHEKPSAYGEVKNLAKKKAKRSQHQSTSFISARAQGPVFGHDKERRNKLVAFIVDAKDALINRAMLYDGGTIGRPYEANTLEEAENYFMTKFGSILFENLEKLEVAMSFDPKRHNEVLARIRWHMKSAKIAICSDTFEARAVAYYYAHVLRQRLIARHQELGLPWDDNYEVPVIYYLPKHIKHWQVYTKEQQESDKARAYKIIADVCLQVKEFSQKNHESLLLIDKPTLIEFLTNNLYILEEWLYDGARHFIEAIISLTEGQELIVQALGNCTPKIPLHTLATANGLELAQLILNSGKADIDARNMNSETALFLAAKHGHIDFVRLLIIAKAKINHLVLGLTPLFIAAQNNYLDIVQLLLEEGADVNLVLPKTAFSFQSSTGKTGATPLFIAAQNGNFDIVKILVAHQAYLNIPFQDTATNLRSFAHLRGIGVLKRLESFIATTKNNTPYIKLTPLDIAAIMGHKEIADYLKQQTIQQEKKKLVNKHLKHVQNDDQSNPEKVSAPLSQDLETTVRDNINNAITDYVHYKDNRFFGLSWLRSSSESYQCYQNLVKNKSAIERLRAIKTFTEQHPEKAFAVSLKKYF